MSLDSGKRDNFSESGRPFVAASAEYVEVRFGSLLPGAVPIGTGINHPRKGFVWLGNGTQVQAIVKQVNPKALAAEIFCATLGRESSILIPEPMIVKDPGAERLLFGSVYEDFPNLLQALQINPANVSEAEAECVLARLAAWSQLDSAISFDEWIANADRHLQNLLWDGFDKFILIDHAFALGQRPKGRALKNCLLTMTVEYLSKNRGAMDRLKNRVLESALRYDADCARVAAETIRRIQVPTVSQCTSEYFEFVSKRLPQLARLLAPQFPTGQLELGV